MSVTDDIKNRLDIVDIISSYTALQKSGNSYKSTCPFHDEKTASFFVFPERQSWRCFGACATGGDIYSFVMKSRNIGFGEALRLLSDQTGIPLPSKDDNSQYQIVKDINDSANAFFQEYLISIRGARTREYLEKRNINPDTLERFELGLSPSSGDSLKNHLTNIGYSTEQLMSAGLIRNLEDNSLKDIFINRLTIPIRNMNHELVGFGARTLSESVPKYINSPKTILFDKSRILYGLHLAKQVADSEGLVIVEGYMDTITAHQNGFTNVVASMGTALTNSQVSQITNLTNKVTMALDADNAGQQATLRSLESSWNVLQNNTKGNGTRALQSLDLQISIMPEGKDPDDVIRESPEDWRHFTNNSTNAFDYILDAFSRQVDIKTPHGKATLVQKLSGFITNIAEPMQQDHYLQILANFLSVNEDTIRASLNRNRRQSIPSKLEPNTNYQETVSESVFSKTNSDPVEEYCLASVLQDTTLIFDCAMIAPDYFFRPENKEIITQITNQISTGIESIDLISLDQSLPEDLSIKVQSLLIKKLPSVDRKTRILALNNSILRLEERYLKSLKTEESNTFNEDDSGTLSKIVSDSTLDTNYKIRMNEISRNSLGNMISRER